MVTGDGVAKLTKKDNKQEGQHKQARKPPKAMEQDAEEKMKDKKPSKE